MTWTQGRRLATMSGNGQSISFTYNADGIRTSKTVNGITHYYHLAGTQILSEEWTDANEVQHLIIYHYDANGQPVGMSYRNSTQGANEYQSFLFVKNLQGDIVKVLDEEGNLLVSYTYDAWGNSTSTTYSNGGASTAVVYNPFRYRGYYYDSELGFYYLNSRYYDPSVGRFINADALVSTGQGILGYNMFAYCNNNPVTNIDHLGESFNEYWEEFKSKLGAAFKLPRTTIIDSFDCFFFGWEERTTHTETLGNDAPPLVVYAEKGESFLKFWDNKVGGSLETSKFSLDFATGAGETTISVGKNGTTVDLTWGIDRRAVAISKSYEKETYSNEIYIRTIPTVAAVLTIAFAPQVGIPAAVALFQKAVAG